MEEKKIVINRNLLHSKLVLHGDTWIILANKLGIYSATLHGKLRGETEFKRSEIAKIIKIYNLSADEVMEIFFNNDSDEVA